MSEPLMSVRAAVSNGVDPGFQAVVYAKDSTRLEYVTTSVGFGDMLDETLKDNLAQVDHAIVVTSHTDLETQAVARNHGATLVVTDLFEKNGRKFSKGAAINAGFSRFQFFGWRMHLDADIILPQTFRRILFNHTRLDEYSLYGCDRVNIVGNDGLRKYRQDHQQHRHSMLVESKEGMMGARFVSMLHGYLPLGFMQLWHAKQQKEYPYSLGDAAHDDLSFSASWPESRRIHLPSVIVHQLCAQEPKWGENWDGTRRQPRLK